MLSKQVLTELVFTATENVFAAKAITPWAEVDETSMLTDEGIFIQEKGGYH
jgi:hypothetical protein